MSSPAPAPLDPAAYRDLIRRALAEDVRGGDVTTVAAVPAGQRAEGVLIVNAACVLAGLDVAAEAFRQLDPGVAVAGLRRDGECCAAGERVARVTGDARALLTAERTALNFLQRLSGIATLTRRYVDAVGGACLVLDTRKTTPTLRALEKYAVRAGGGANHRSALDDGILIKDNHIQVVGSLEAAVRRVRAAGGELPLEVEVDSLDAVDAALAAGADIILLDNLPPRVVREAVARIAGRAQTEASGGVTPERAAELAATGVTRISVGALTHSAPAVDCSFDLHPASDGSP